MTTLQNFGVPVDGKKLGIIMPWYGYRWRIAVCPLSISANIEKIDIDFKARTISMEVRASIEPQAFMDAMQFTDNRKFEIDAMDGGNDKAYFGLVPFNLELVSHTFGLHYGQSKYAAHLYVFSFESINIRMPEKVEVPAAPVVEGFKDVATAMADYEAQRKAK